MFRRIVLPIANRSEYAKIKYFVKQVIDDNFFDLTILATGSMCSQRHGNAIDEVLQDQVRVDYLPVCLIDDDSIENTLRSMSLQLAATAEYLASNHFDMGIIVGDRWDAVPSVTALSLFNYPIAHIQGGEVSGTIDNIIRGVITKYSHIHFVSTDECKHRVEQMGELSEYVHVVGCPGLDHLLSIDLGPDIDIKELGKYMKDPVDICKEDEYFVVMVHPNVTDRDDVKICELVSALDQFDNKVVWFYPNNDPFNEEIVQLMRRRRDIIKFSHLPRDVFLKLLAHSSCLIGNSSTGIREAASLGVPVVNVGTRQIGRDRNSNVVDVKFNRYDIEKGIKQSVIIECNGQNIYGDGHSSARIIEVLKHYNVLKYKNIDYGL